MTVAASFKLDSLEAGEVLTALRVPRGRYVAERASQLSGIPKSTLYWWARRGVLVPDFANADPMNWSYRDLVLGRLMGWLRMLGMPLGASAERVALVRSRLPALAEKGAMVVRGDGRSLLLQEQNQDELSGQFLFEGLVALLPIFDLFAPLGSVDLALTTAEMDGPPEEFPRKPKRAWGPNLVRPSQLTRISPWVMAGEPCIVDTRIPTASIWVLTQERALDMEAISRLYPGVEQTAISQALDLERRLRAA
jgi:uncharacterized protein (DUF433 family)/DNA-binding transcriptional MerR regulator